MLSLGGGMAHALSSPAARASPTTTYSTHMPSPQIGAQPWREPRPHSAVHGGGREQGRKNPPLPRWEDYTGSTSPPTPTPTPTQQRPLNGVADGAGGTRR
eukprot:2345424-Rhodomonas_salina.1